MSTPPDRAEYSISAVSKLTGASCHALRVWERRYGFPIPHRSASGHRRYGRDQVRILQVIAEQAQAGRAIGELIAEYRTKGAVGFTPPADRCDVPDALGVPGLVDRLIDGDWNASEAYYRQLTDALNPVEIVARVIGPSWIEAGERWFQKASSVYHERVVSEFLVRKLAMMIDAARKQNANSTRTVLVGTVQGDRHVGGVLMLSLVMEWAGWRVINLGVDLPVTEYHAAVEEWRPDSLALSFVLSRNIKKRFQELQQIRGLPIFVGGRSILNYQGLARRHGLIPLPGPVTTAALELQNAFDKWLENREQNADS